MSVIARLSCSLGRNDEQPNIALAEEIARSRGRRAVDELVACLKGSDRAARSDAIKVLYEIGERSPVLIAPHLQRFLDLLASRENRLVWGAMCAIDAIASVRPTDVFKHLAMIRSAAEAGTVITRDHAVKAMVKLAKNPALALKVMPLLRDELEDSPVNQLPMYAELVSTVANDKRTIAALEAVLARRMQTIHQPSKRRRLEAVLRKLRKKLEKTSV